MLNFCSTTNTTIMYIYKIINTVNDKCYIGQTTNIPKKRWNSHRSMLNMGKHHNHHLQSAWNKYGADAFVFQHSVSIECRQNVSNFIEKAFIVLNVNNYNLKSGGEAGGKMSEETKTKIGLSNRGKTLGVARGPRTQEVKDKLRKANLGKTLSPEARSKMSASRIGNTYAKGSVRTLEHRAAISTAQRGRTLSASHKEALVQSNRRRKGIKRHSIETI